MSGLMGSPAQPSGRAIVTSKLGWAGVAAVGYGLRTDVLGFQNGIRLELEGNFRSNDVNKVKEFGQNLARSTGVTRSYGAIANVYGDVFVGRFAGVAVTPYLGLGVGFADDALANEAKDRRRLRRGRDRRHKANRECYRRCHILAIALHQGLSRS